MKKLLVVGFSFVVMGIGMIFIQNMPINDEVNAATIVPSNIDPNTRPYDYAELKKAHWVNGATTKGDSVSDLDVDDKFFLGEWAGRPLEWRLIWDYGDGTGLAATAESIKKTDGTFEMMKYLEVDPFLYGDDQMISKTQTGGVSSGFTQRWWQTIGNTQGKMGIRVVKKNRTYPIPFMQALYDMDVQTTGKVGAYGWFQENTGHIGIEELQIHADTSRYFKGPMWLRLYRSSATMAYYLCPDNTLYYSDISYPYTIAPLIYINLPESVDLSYSAIVTDFQEGKGSSANNTKIGEFAVAGGDNPYSAISLITTGTTTATDVDEKGTLVGSGLPLSNAFTLANPDNVNNTVDLMIGNASLTQGVYYVKAKVTDNKNEVSEIIIKINVAATDITGVLTPTQNTSFVYGELQNMGVFGTVSATDSNGDVTSLTTFEFVKADGSLSNDSEDGALSIIGTNVSVKDTSSLGAGTYSYTMRATKDAKFSDFTFDVIVDKMPLTITTKIGGTSYPTIPLNSVINATGYGASSYSASATLPYNETLEVSGTPAMYLYKNTTTNATTTTPETTVGTYKLEVDFPGATADLANNYILTYDHSLLEIVADSFTSLTFASSKTPLVYGDTETMAGGKIGDFSLVTSGGTTNATYEFVNTANDTSGSSASTSKDELEIRNNEIFVKSGGKLNAKIYDYFILVTTSTGISHVESITFTVDKRPVTIQTNIKNGNAHTIDELDPLPIPSDLSYTATNGSFLGTDATGVTYEYYQGNTTTVVANPSSTAGSYALNMNLVDESNYDITKNRAVLTVRGNSINSFVFDADKTTHEYGEIETTASGSVGQFTIGTVTGNDIIGTTYHFADASGTNVGSISGDGLLSINADKVNVSAGKKLSAGSYSYNVLATTPKGLTKTMSITFTISKRPITVQTSISGSSGITNIDVGNTLPTNITSAVANGSNAFLFGDNASTPTFQYLKNGIVVADAMVNKNAATYDLDVIYADETNYDITKKRAQLKVNGNTIKQIDYTGQSTAYTYGDSAISSGPGQGVLGALSIKTESGQDETNPTFALCEDALGTNPQSIRGVFMISANNEIVITTGRLDAGSYTLYVKATSKVQRLESMKTITVSVNKKDVHVSIKNPTSLNKKVGEDITKRSVTRADYDVVTMENGDTLSGTATYQYEAGKGYTDLSTAVGIQLKGLSESNSKSNYTIFYDVANISVSQDTIGTGDYDIVGTSGTNNWYTSAVDITILKSGYDEFVSILGVSSGNSIHLTTNGIINQHLQLRNSSSGAITTSTNETIKIDTQVPDFTLHATVGGSAYTSDTPSNGPIRVTMNETANNVSGVTYYYTTNASDASSTDPKGSPSLWTSIGDGIDFKEFSQPERATYYFKAVSGAGLVSPTEQSIGIYNNSTIPNPANLKWVNTSRYDMVYGDSKSLAVMNDPIVNNPITYSFKDSNGNAIDVSSCLNIDVSGQLHAINGVCGVSDIVVYAQVGNYTTPLQKVITVSKAPITIQALYQNGANFAPTAEILTNDLEPAKKVGLANGSQFVGAETTMGVNDLGTYQYGYVKGGGSSTSSPDLTSIGIYTVTPSFASSTQGILDKYDITWSAATLTINDSNIAASSLYDIVGLKGKDDWYIQKPISIQPIHADFKNMSIDGGTASSSTQMYSVEGDAMLSLTFSDQNNRSISKSQQIKIDTLKPQLTIQASSGSNSAYVSNTYTEEDIQINSIKQPIGASNPSGVKYYYTNDIDVNNTNPEDSAGNVNAGWIETSGNFDIHNKATYYFKAVSGAGISGDAVIFVANINKPDYTLQPTVSATSGGRYYAADGSWVKDDVIFTLSGSAMGYEVCTATVEGPCTTWNDILDQGTSTHTISGDVTNQFYYFRIKSTTNPYAQSGSFKVSLDKGKPTTPVITLQAKNTGPIARVVNALSFGAWMKEAQEVSMQSSDTLSGLKEIRYDVKNLDGSIVQSDVLYSTAITYYDAAYVLSAKAIDMAGNASEVSGDTNVFIDLIAPSIEGVKDDEIYYLPYAFVHYRDDASGIDVNNTTQSNGSTTTALGNDTLFNGKGNVSIVVSDQAGNTTSLSFRIDGLPDMSSWTCSEDHDDVIETVKKQYEELKKVMATHKMKLSDAQEKEVETWLKKATGTCQISEPENNVTVESEADRIPENTVLIVDVVTTELKPDEVNVEKGEEIKMAFDVYFNHNGTIMKNLNDSTLTVRLPMGAFKGAKGLRLVEILDDGTVKKIDYVVEDGKAVFKTKVLTKYAFIAEKSKINVDSDEDGKPDINVDFGNDEKPDINIDIDDDGNPDVNIDTNGDGKPDYNIDINDDGLPDVNIGPIQKPWKPDKCQRIESLEYCTSMFKKPYLNIDTDDDGRPDINLDLDKDDIPELNIDVNDDGVPDIDIDCEGEGIKTCNIDTNGDGRADKNLVRMAAWIPNKDVDGMIKYDTMTNLTPIPNQDEDTSGDGDSSNSTGNSDNVLGSYNQNTSSGGVGGAGTGDTNGVVVSWMLVIGSCAFSVLIHFVKRYRKNQVD